MSQRKLLIVDTETGGLDPQEHSILTLGAVVWHEGAIDDEILLEIAEPEIKATPGALAVNGIDIDCLRETGETPLIVVQKLKVFLQKNGFFKAAHIGGHNVASFDWGFIKRLFRLAGEPIEKTLHYRMLDTMTLAIALEQAGRLPTIKNMGLDSLCTHFGIVIRPGGKDAPHNALEDARATAKLLTRMLDMIRK